MPMVERLLAEIRRSLEFYTTQEKGAAVEKILLTGGASKLQGLAEFLEARLGVPVRRVTGWGGLKLPDGNFGAEYQVAFGLALHVSGAAHLRVNLIPADLHLRRRRERRAGQWKMLGGLLVAAVGFALLGGWIEYDRQQKRVVRLQEELRAPVRGFDGKPILVGGRPIAHEEVLARLDEIAKEREAVKQRFNAISDLLKGRRDWLPVLEELARLLPENTWIDQNTLQLTTSQDRLPLKMVTLERGEISEFYNRVRNSRWFRIDEASQALTVSRVERNAASLGLPASGENVTTWEYNVVLMLLPAEEEDEASASDAAAAASPKPTEEGADTAQEGADTASPPTGEPTEGTDRREGALETTEEDTGGSEGSE